MSGKTWKVGDLAKETGLTVRTLHHYDEIGLLTPSSHTESGHRLYSEKDVQRLQQIKSLRYLGLSLEEIQDSFKKADFSALKLVNDQLKRVKEMIGLQEKLHGLLEKLKSGLEAAGDVSVENLIQTIEVMTMFEKYYTPEQLRELEARGQAPGQDRIKEVENQWKELGDLVKAEMEKGSDPASPQVQALATRWMGLVREFTGGNPGVEKSLKNFYQGESKNISSGQHAGKIDPEMPKMMEYIGKAMALMKKKSF